MCVTPDDIEKLKEIDARIELRREIIKELEEEQLAEEIDERIYLIEETSSTNTRNISNNGILLFLVFVGLFAWCLSVQVQVSNLKGEVFNLKSQVKINYSESHDRHYILSRDIFNNAMTCKGLQDDIKELSNGK